MRLRRADLRSAGLGSAVVVVDPASAGVVAAGVGSAPPSGVRLESLGGFDRWARCASHRLIAFDPSGILRAGTRSWPPESTGEQVGRLEACATRAVRRTVLRTAGLGRTG